MYPTKVSKKLSSSKNARDIIVDDLGLASDQLYLHEVRNKGGLQHHKTEVEHQIRSSKNISNSVLPTVLGEESKDGDDLEDTFSGSSSSKK